MKTNKKGLDLIKSFEGCSLKAYRCPAGKITIGYGHVSSHSQEGDTITQDVADLMLESDVANSEQVVNTAVRVPLNENQFSALVSFVFNVGVANFMKSTLLRLLNQEKYAEAADQLLRWNKSNGRELLGLTRRRQAERELFNA